MPKILVLNGPNLNLLGRREPGIYGAETLEEIGKRLRSQAESASATLEFQQFNAEHAMIEALAETLETIANEGIDSFYKGPIAADIAKTVQNDRRGAGILNVNGGGVLCG